MEKLSDEKMLQIFATVCKFLQIFAVCRVHKGGIFDAVCNCGVPFPQCNHASLQLCYKKGNYRLGCVHSPKRQRRLRTFAENAQTGIGRRRRNVGKRGNFRGLFSCAKHGEGHVVDEAVKGVFARLISKKNLKSTAI